MAHLVHRQVRVTVFRTLVSSDIDKLVAVELPSGLARWRLARPLARTLGSLKFALGSTDMSQVPFLLACMTSDLSISALIRGVVTLPQR